MSESREDIASHGSSTGHVLASPSWLDTHFFAMQTEYEEILKWVGI
jgi:hypothetical protein